MIAGFILSILTVLAILVGFVMPRYYDAFIPLHRRGDGTEPTTALHTKGEVTGMPVSEMANAENGQGGLLPRNSDSEPEVKKDKS